MYGLLCSLLSVENRGRVATVVGKTWWASSGSLGSSVLFVKLLAGTKICPSSTSYYLSGCSLKTQSHQPPHSGADYAYGCHRSGKHMRKIKATFLWHVNCKITWIETKKGFRWFLTRRHKETFPSILLLMCLTVTHPECCRRYKHTCITLQTNHRYQKEFAHLMHISIRIVLLMQGKPKPIAMHVIYLFSKWWILKHRLCGCAYLVSGRVLSSSDGPSRLSVFGDWNTTTEKE